MYIQKLFDYSAPLVAAATILVIGGLLMVLIGSYAAYSIKVAGDTVVVTGSAKESVVADTARLTMSLDARTSISEQQKGYTQLEEATAKIVTYLTAREFVEYETLAITSSPTYIYPQYGEPILTGFSVNRMIIIRSSDIEAISALANNMSPFSGPDYTVTMQALELTYGKLDEMRIRLLGKAIADAKARAEAIAVESGRTVGVLRTASSGVVQVLPQGGVDISDYGSYDTQSLHKEVMVTVRATFEL